jgi:phage shock protein PspC (stress-responsive transcriptional regulator)
MNTKIIAGFFTSLSLLLATTGCRTDYGAGSPYQPGPVIGKTVGNGVGLVAGNAAGLGVGAVEGTVHGVADAFDPSYHLVRIWKTQTTADGRTVQVPEDILVDKYGRPVTAPPPTGNLPPPAGVLPVPAPAAER